VAYEPPTRRIPPTPPTPPPGGVRETEYVADPEREELRDRIRSLRTALALTALLALAGLGVGLYTLLAEDEEDNGRRGASPARVSALSDRVDDLEERVGDRATKNSVTRLEQRQEELEGQIEQAGEAGGDAEALQESLEQVNTDVQALEQRVDDLAAQQEEGTTPP
jgi:chromosome segregation ATPase